MSRIPSFLDTEEAQGKSQTEKKPQFKKRIYKGPAEWLKQ
jgi:hypothetical protein